MPYEGLLTSTKVLLMAILIIQIDVMDLIKASHALDPALHNFILHSLLVSGKYHVIDRFNKRKGNLLVRPYKDLIGKLMHKVHTGGHGGRDATLKTFQ